MKGKIAYIPQARTIEFHEFDLPEVEPGAILAQVTRTNICGSEVHMWRGEFGKRGVMPGHEMVGRVSQRLQAWLVAGRGAQRPMLGLTRLRSVQS